MCFLPFVTGGICKGKAAEITTENNQLKYNFFLNAKTATLILLIAYRTLDISRIGVQWKRSNNLRI